MSSIYEDTRNLVRSTFSGQEDHQTLRKKIISLPRLVRQNIKDAAAEMGCQSKKEQVAEAVYWILYDLKEEPLAECPVCSKRYRGKYYSISEGYRFHDHCSARCRNRNPEYVKKLEATNLERYGHRNNMHGAETRARTKEMWVQKYGVDVPTKSEEIKSKVKRTNRERLGVDWPAQNRQVYEKYKSTMMKRHGVDNGFKHPNTRAGMMEKFGVENPSQSPVLFRKTLRGLRSTKQGVLPSGKAYTYQGFENVAIENLLSIVSEQDLVIGDPSKIPVIEYYNPLKGKTSKYFPDIWIPSLNLLVEVKSTWTMKRDLAVNMAKHQAARVLGFKHEIWICSKEAVLEVLM